MSLEGRLWVSACGVSHHVVAQPVGTTAQDASYYKRRIKLLTSKRLLCYTAMSDSFKKKTFRCCFNCVCGTYCKKELGYSCTTKDTLKRNECVRTEVIGQFLTCFLHCVKLITVFPNFVDLNELSSDIAGYFLSFMTSAVCNTVSIIIHVLATAVIIFRTNTTQ